MKQTAITTNGDAKVKAQGRETFEQRFANEIEKHKTFIIQKILCVYAFDK
jgi:hypothetical protein